VPQFALTAQIELSAADAALLCDVLGCNANQLEATLSRYAPAAIQEFIDMFLGVGAITTATEVRERRLVRLIRAVFQATPEADEVSRLFNITPSAARSLLRSVAAKHRLELRDQLGAALKAVLDNCQQAGANQPHTVTITNKVLVELLNARLAASNRPRTPVSPSGDSLNGYKIDPGSFTYLRTLFP
jgi:hypothetical protein